MHAEKNSRGGGELLKNHEIENLTVNIGINSVILWSLCRCCRRSNEGTARAHRLDGFYGSTR